jgi:hypothetical protein
LSVLSSGLRSVLERAVGDGRSAAEAAAIGALSRLGVAELGAPEYLTADELRLREGLLARSVQLGDLRKGSAVDVAVPLLVGEVAYEQWHRLLFARFLTENGLLMHPEFGAPVSLEECEEIAESLAEPDGWSVAARFASQILPGIFRLDDPAVLVRLAPEDRLALEKIVTGLPAEVFTADDALGWVYQYWQSKQKKLVNDSGRKIGGAEISPVTQLFTEDYMVRFLLENSLGAWWAAQHPHSPLIAGWDFLRFNEDGSPAAGSFDGWPVTVDQVTVMDPCCGSGHFLVAAFGMLWRMRAEAEGLAPAEAQDAVLRDNLFGLELDPRCTQIAMFNLALEAWKQGGYRKLPTPNVACSGIPAKAPLHEWTILAKGDIRLEAALTRLYELFKDADTLGSLIDPRSAAEQDDLFYADWDTVAPLLGEALSKEYTDAALSVFGHAAAGIAHAADLLSRNYTLFATNPPYLKRARQSDQLAELISDSYPEAKHELALAIFDRFRRSSVMSACVLPHGWLFMSWYAKLRAHVLQAASLRLIGTLGTGAFSQISGEVVNVDVVVAQGADLSTDRIAFISADAVPTPSEKAQALRKGAISEVSRSNIRASNGMRIGGSIQDGPLLSQYAQGYAGIQSGDYPRFGRFFWELQELGEKWEFQQSTVKTTVDHGGRSHVFLWERGEGQYIAFVKDRLGENGTGAWVRGTAFEGRQGVAFSSMGKLGATLYSGELFDNNTAVVIPGDEADLPALWAFAESGEWQAAVREIDQSIKVTNSTFVKVPFDIERWSLLAEDRYPSGLPLPTSNDPTQWLFEGMVSEATEPLQAAVARLLNFSWPSQITDDRNYLADEDGIVCLPPIAGEGSAAERLRALLANSYVSDWSTAKLDNLLSNVGSVTGDLDGWLRNDFFRHHAGVFENRPFIWHIWDGRDDGFSALVNYHLLDRKTLEKLTYTTLGWWIQKQKDDAANEVAGAAVRLAAADQLKSKLELILRGEPPYDIYVRWKSLAEQPIGWDPDLDDGVRMNIRPFVEAGILRAKFTINWNKDRGTNPDGTERFNDLHYTKAQKHQARGGTA